MKITAFVQARMASTRLPGKAMLPLAGKPMFYRVVERVQQCKLVADVIVVTGRSEENQLIRDACYDRKIRYYSGSDDDVLDRFYETAIAADVEHVMRITADCPLIDPDVLTALVKGYVARWNSASLSYASVSTGTPNNTLGGRRFPDGFDAEIFDMKTLAWAWGATVTTGWREHVTPVMVQELRGGTRITADQDYGHLRLTVDDQEDYERVALIFNALYHKKHGFRLADILDYLKHDTVVESSRSI